MEFQYPVNMEIAFFSVRFGERFQALLKARGLTQFEAAKLLEMDQSTISYYCHLESAPRPHTLRHIAERLGFTVDELMGRGEVRAGAKRSISKITTPAVSASDRAYADAMKSLKVRWKKRPQERETIKHLIAALFTDKSDSVLAWLESQ
jgi:transcriptional regulator with XRE-family HTH domain